MKKSHSSLVVVCLLSALAAPAQTARHGEWTSYASDWRSSKYSPLDQIDKSNVAKLEIAWRWKSIDYGAERQHDGLAAANMMETTPLMRDGKLLLGTGLGLATALDPRNGETLWVYDPFAGGEEPDPRSQVAFLRGGVLWSSGDEERLLYASNGDFVSLDTATGRPDPSFGDGGRLDLAALSNDPEYGYFWTSPAVVCRDTLIVGNSTRDLSFRKKAPAGTVRGFDVRTGKPLWTFHLVPKEGEYGYDTWEDGSADYTGHSNVWTWMSCDEELGYVYAPTTTPNNDWYGGHRPGDGLFSESLVCLEARTGKRVWHFQAVHHGLWDYDFPAGPILADINVDGRPIKAVAQVSKQAFVYVFDRTNGEPVWPIVELPVPPSIVPGEKASPTQPFPTWPKPFDLQGLNHDDVIDFTPELRAEALEILADYRLGPLFQPPEVEGTDGLKGVVQVPSAIGGANWTGAALDPETNVLYVPSVTGLFVVDLTKPTSAVSNVDYVVDIGKVKLGEEGGFEHLAFDDGLPLTKPPYGRITAIDLDTGEHLWVTPNGDGPRDHPRLAHLDLPPLGQPGRASALVTRTLLFIGEGSSILVGTPPGGGGRMFRALDKATGEVVWETELPAAVTGAPMTYMHEGKQYIVVGVGETEHEAELIALALP